MRFGLLSQSAYSPAVNDCGTVGTWRLRRGLNSSDFGCSSGGRKAWKINVNVYLSIFCCENKYSSISTHQYKDFCIQKTESECKS